MGAHKKKNVFLKNNENNPMEPAEKTFKIYAIKVKDGRQKYFALLLTPTNLLFFVQVQLRIQVSPVVPEY